MRRISRTEPSGTTAVSYSGGLSAAEYTVASASTAISNPASSVVEGQRGPDMGGGVGGLLYSLRSGTAKFNLSNGRGDVVAQSDDTGALTWTASYEAYGKRPVETGSNADRQRANTKEEDPTGLLNEGFRYRDLETGVWLSRDPAGFVDGPNLYAYVRQNPWTGWDPHGLAEGYQGYWEEVGEFWQGIGDVTMGAVVSLGESIVDIPSNVAQIYRDQKEILELRNDNYGLYLEANKQANEELEAKVLEVIVDKGTELENGDSRAWGQAIGTFLTIVASEGAPFTKAARVTPVKTTPVKVGGRGKNNLKPDTNAKGPHTTFKKDANGKVTGHAEWTPNQQNPTGFDQVKRVDTQHSNSHTHANKMTKKCQLLTHMIKLFPGV